MHTRTLNIDIETYSSVDIKSAGMYKYVQSPDFEVMLLAYSIDGSPVTVIDTQLDDMDDYAKYFPHTKLEHLFSLLTDPTILKTAYNAAFERTCLSKYFDLPMPPDQWECTMVKAAMLGFPLGLDAAASAMKLPQQKMKEGRALIKYFCCPCKPTKTNGMRARNTAADAPDKWKEFIEYCRQDVVTEMAIREKIKWFEISQSERQLWQLDQRINDRGILLDPQLIENAIEFDRDYSQRVTAKARDLTLLDNPNSVAQLKAWIAEETGERVESLSKDVIDTMISVSTCETVKEVLKMRQVMSKTSVKKYEAMTKTIGKDNRVRGLLQFYGAPRTGRFAGRLIQMQNLPQNHLKDLDLARQLVREGDLDMLELLFGNVPDVLSQLIRTAFIAPPGKKLLPVDFASIELVVGAWLSGEQWILDEFQGERKIYEKTAARMMNCDVSAVTKQDRQKGKIGTLACQYGGGSGALEAMGAVRVYGLQLHELDSIVEKWRLANRNIVKYWKTLENAALNAVREPGKKVKLPHGITFFVQKGILFMKLPSGRCLAYPRPQIVEGRFGGDSVSYEGIDQYTRKWTRLKTYGGKWFENACQAVARDVLGHAMLRIDAAGHLIVGHVHDEIIPEVDLHVQVSDIVDIMCEPIPWAKGLPLAAEGFETEYYKK